MFTQYYGHLGMKGGRFLAEKLTESNPSWFLIGFRLQRGGGGEGMGYKNAIQGKKNLTFEW